MAGLLGPACAGGAGSSTPSALDGTYRLDEYVLAFGGGRYHAVAGANFDFTGTYSVSGQRVTLSAGQDCTGPGTYDWSLAGPNLTFHRIGDVCGGRKFLLEKSGWRRVPRIGSTGSATTFYALSDGWHVALFGGTGDAAGKRTFTLTVKQNDRGFYWSPTIITGSPGERVQLSIVSEATEGHTFTIPGRGVDVSFTQVRGVATPVDVTFPRSGSLTFICRFHWTYGQSGELRTA